MILVKIPVHRKTASNKIFTYCTFFRRNLIFTLFREWIHQNPLADRSVAAFATRHPAPVVRPAASATAAAVMAVAVVTATAVSPREVAAASVIRTAVGSPIEVRIRPRLVSPLVRPIP